MAKKRWRDMCFLSLWEYVLCKVLNNAEFTRAPGQIMLDGYTRNLLNRPAREYPMSWEDRQTIISYPNPKFLP
jgi:hypothetical protein